MKNYRKPHAYYSAVFRVEFESAFYCLMIETTISTVSRFQKLKPNFQVLNKKMFESRDNDT